MNIGSLFAGIGGFDLAAERAGMTVTWQSENNPHASRVLAHHFAAPNLGDIHGIQPSAVDVLTGGFPCQDYSVAGHRGGLAGDRGALWWEYHRLIGSIRPTWVVAENVPGLLSSRNGEDFETIISSLTELGYGVTWAVLDAQYFGVAQRRRRVFIVGHSGGQPRPEILALSEGLYGHPAPSREAGEGTTADVATSLKASGKYDHVGDEAKLIGFAWQAGGNNSASGAYEYDHTPTLPVGQTMAVAFAQNQRDEVYESAVTFALAAGGGKPGQGYQAIRQGSSVRRLTPLECERLQGFPDHWTDIPGNSDTQRYRQLGNAVAVPVVEWILKRLT